MANKQKLLNSDMERTTEYPVSRPKLLIISFSEIYRDVRILKQIRLFADEYEVTTCGFGPRPSERVTHFEIPKKESEFTVKARAAAIRLHLYGFAYWMTYAVRVAVKQLRGKNFDVIIANDLMTVGVARRIAHPSQIHVDLHEYWPGLHDGDPVWVKVRQPYNEWLIRKFVVPAASVTVVSEPIRELYEQGFGFDSYVVPNASPFLDLPPSEQVSDRLSIVHAGGASPARRIEDLMRAVAAVPIASLDLYLVGEGTEYYQSLLDLADTLGERIQVLPPVPSTDLVPTLNLYDVGIHQLPPTNTNHVVAMPNKFTSTFRRGLPWLLDRTQAWPIL